MAEDHVTLDSNDYPVLLDGYSHWINKGERNTLTLSGKDDTVFPAKSQEGWDLVLRVTHTELGQLQTTWLKTTTVDFTDSLDAGHTVLCLGPLSERPLTPILDGALNKYNVPITLKVAQ